MPKRSILILLIIFIGLVVVFNKNLSKKNVQILDNNAKDTQSVDPLDKIAFYELTIPGLRSRSYISQLSDRVKYQEKKNYTSYLTSYDSDGLKINGLLTIPKEEKPSGGFPAILFVHGYIPPSLYKTTEKYIDYVDYLARSGFVVFKIDLRGHGDSEGEPTGAYYSGGYVIDTLNAYNALENADFVNPKKIGLWGHSMAGNIAFRSFVVKKNIPALAIWAGAVYSYDDLLKYRLNDNSYRPPEDRSRVNEERIKLRETYGDYQSNNDFWRQVVPLNYLDGVNGSINLHHAVNDTVVNIGYSRDLMAALNNTSITHNLFEYSDGGHNISGSNFSVAMKRTVDFFESTLK